MTETTTRIRWHDKTPGNSDVYNIAHIGYVGTVEESAFIIYTPDTMHADWLLSVRLIPGSTFLYADTPGELKAEAERWLEEFVASLGAIFPGEPYDFGDDDGEPLEVKYAPGRRVRYVHPDYGYPGEQEVAAAILVFGAAYTIAQHSIGQSRTDLILEGIPGEWFNSVLFEPAGDETTGGRQ